MIHTDMYLLAYLFSAEVGLLTYLETISTNQLTTLTLNYLTTQGPLLPPFPL